MIDGVKTKKLQPIADERGRLMEILRRDDELFRKFGQVYITTVYPGVIKAWHYHKKQHDNLTVVKGMVKLVLYDPREDSPTRGDINEFFIGDHNPMLVSIPPLVLHGFKCIGETEAIALNLPTEPYDRRTPDEYREPPHGGPVPYDWSRKDG
ncbi:MAG: dTDP-4-dehydrorhamnose 3,5-epimerase family protein [Planctomycetota bacterium]